VQALGDHFSIWMRRDGTPEFTPANARAAVLECQAEGFAAEAEIPSVWINPATDELEPYPPAMNWPELIFQLSDLLVHKMILTNFAPFITYVRDRNGKWVGVPWPEKARPLIDAGWRCGPEAYDMDGEPDGDPSWIERRAFAAKQLGWNVSQPGCGCFGGRTLDDFPDRHDHPNWWVWSAENVV
jgi:hypothetical protein